MRHINQIGIFWQVEITAPLRVLYIFGWTNARTAFLDGV